MPLYCLRDLVAEEELCILNAWGQSLSFVSSVFLPPSDESTLSSVRRLLLHAYVISFDEATSLYMLPCALLGRVAQAWPALWP